MIEISFALFLSAGSGPGLFERSTSVAVVRPIERPAAQSAPRRNVDVGELNHEKQVERGQLDYEWQDEEKENVS